MSSNHLKYDTCAYATTVKESTEPLEYWLYKGKYEVCNPCKNGDFTNNLEFTSRADVESELFGLTRQSTDCPSLKYDPTKQFNNPMFSPPILCQSIYGITPSNLVNPTSNMLNENNLGINLCSPPLNDSKKLLCDKADSKCIEYFPPGSKPSAKGEPAATTGTTGGAAEAKGTGPTGAKSSK